MSRRFSPNHSPPSRYSPKCCSQRSDLRCFKTGHLDIYGSLRVRHYGQPFYLFCMFLHCPRKNIARHSNTLLFLWYPLQQVSRLGISWFLSTEVCKRMISYAFDGFSKVSCRRWQIMIHNKRYLYIDVSYGLVHPLFLSILRVVVPFQQHKAITHTQGSLEESSYLTTFFLTEAILCSLEALRCLKPTRGPRKRSEAWVAWSKFSLKAFNYKWILIKSSMVFIRFLKVKTLSWLNAKFWQVWRSPQPERA